MVCHVLSIGDDYAGGDEVKVLPADLHAHARHIDEVADEIATAHQAARTTEPSTDAYGKLCVIVPLTLNAVHGPVVDGIGSAVESVRDTAARVRSAADRYQSTDEESAARFQKIRRAG